MGSRMGSVEWLECSTRLSAWWPWVASYWRPWTSLDAGASRPVQGAVASLPHYLVTRGSGKPWKERIEPGRRGSCFPGGTNGRPRCCGSFSGDRVGVFLAGRPTELPPCENVQMEVRDCFTARPCFDGLPIC